MLLAIVKNRETIFPIHFEPAPKKKKCTLGLVKTWRVVKFSAVVLNLRIEELNGSSRKPSILRRTVATADFKGNVADFLGTKR